jgi:hypothetical protein
VARDRRPEIIAGEREIPMSTTLDALKEEWKLARPRQAGESGGEGRLLVRLPER